MILNSDIVKLYELAKKATPGKWSSKVGRSWLNGQVTDEEFFVMREEDDVAIAVHCIDPVTGLPSKENADYIAAANPEAIIKLIDELNLLKEVYRDLLNELITKFELRV